MNTQGDNILYVLDAEFVSFAGRSFVALRALQVSEKIDPMPLVLVTQNSGSTIVIEHKNLRGARIGNLERLLGHVTREFTFTSTCSSDLPKAGDILIPTGSSLQRECVSVKLESTTFVLGGRSVSLVGRILPVVLPSDVINGVLHVDDVQNGRLDVVLPSGTNLPSNGIDIRSAYKEQGERWLCHVERV